jgi:hypothetical protein
MKKNWSWHIMIALVMCLITCYQFSFQPTNVIYNVNETYNITSAPHAASPRYGRASTVFSESKNHTVVYNSFKRWLKENHTPTVIPLIGFNFAAKVFFDKQKFYTSLTYLFSLSSRVHSLRGPPASLVSLA